jgi:hypothetical protein
MELGITNWIIYNSIIYIHGTLSEVLIKYSANMIILIADMSLHHKLVFSPIIIYFLS